jgi:hypothetical protein
VGKPPSSNVKIGINGFALRASEGRLSLIHSLGFFSLA